MNRFLMLVILIFCAPIAGAQNIDSLESVIANTVKLDSSQLETLYALGDYYLNRDPQKATGYLRRGYRHGVNHRIPIAEVLFGRLLGVSKRRLNDYDSARIYLKYSAAKSTEINDLQNLGLAYSSLGNLYKGLSLYDSAVYFYLQGARLFEELKYAKGLGLVYNGLGNIYVLINDLDKATHYLKLAAKNFEGNSAYEVAVVTNNLGNVFFKREKFDSALVYYNLSKDIKESLNIRNGLDDSYLNIGIVYTNTKKYSLAQAYLSKSLELRKTFHNKEKLIQCYNNLAELNIISGNYHKAQQYLDESKALTYEIGSLEEQKYILKYQLRLDSLQKNYHDAFQTALALSSVQDSLMGLEKSMQIAKLQTQYETEKKDNEIASLSQQARIHALLLKQKNIQLAGGGALLLVLALVGFLVNKQRTLSHRQTVSELEQRTLRLQMNPHFIFNALSSIQTYILQSNPQESVSYLAKFGKLIRQILEHSREEYICIRQEVDMLRNYLEIQQFRYGNQFQFQIKVDPAIDQEHLAIPPLFAQPFVENAIEHGVSGRENGYVEVRFIAEKNRIRLIVEDNGAGISDTRSSKTHKSLAQEITRDRLKLLGKRYRSSFQLHLTSGLNGTIASLELPVDRL